MVPSAFLSNGRICSRRDNAPSWQKRLRVGNGAFTFAPAAAIKDSIEANETASGITAGGLSVCFGLINAACLTT